MAISIKLNYDHKALASVVNYDRKRDTTIWSVKSDIIIGNRHMFILQAT